MTTYNLTENEFAAAMVLVRSCLANMGGARPADLEGDPLTWVEPADLVKAGWKVEAANATFGALMEKHVVSACGKGSSGKEEWALNDAAWQWLDTKWDEAGNYSAFPLEKPAKAPRKSRKAPAKVPAKAPRKSRKGKAAPVVATVEGKGVNGPKGTQARALMVKAPITAAAMAEAMGISVVAARSWINDIKRAGYPVVAERKDGAVYYSLAK